MSHETIAYRERLIAEFTHSVDQMLEARELTDLSLQAADATAAAAASALGAADRINNRLGAFYSLDRVRKVLGDVSRQAVNERVRAHRLLRVRTSDGVYLFPAFQFRNGRVAPAHATLTKTLLSTGADPWAVAYWLTAPLARFEGATAVDIIASDDVDKIMHLRGLATEDAAGWA